MCLKHSCADEIERENLAFHACLTLFLKNIQSNFPLRLVFRKIEMAIAPLNCPSQFKLHYR